jgi:glycosyltransferase involved in cell wall biosynthesis
MVRHVDASADAPLIAEGLYSFQIGGSERVGVNLAIEFERRGYRTLCFAFYDSDGPMRAVAEAAGIRCIDFNYLRRTCGVRRLTYQAAFFRLLQHERVAALHVHHATALILCGLPAFAARVPRVVMTEHSIHQFVEQPSYRRSAIRFCRFADAVTLVDAQQVRYFRDQIHVPPAKLHHIPNGVRMHVRDAETRRRVRREIGVPDDAFMLLYAGRLQPIKDLGTLLRAAGRLRRSDASSLRVVIAGDGADRERLERTSAQLELGNTVTFLGERSDVAALLGAADTFIMTSLSEGLPMALLEAMASGVPCIATAVGGIPELFSGDAGLLAPPGSDSAIATTIARAMNDADLRRTLSERGRATIEQRHDLDTIVTRYLALLGLPPTWPASKGGGATLHGSRLSDVVVSDRATRTNV